MGRSTRAIANPLPGIPYHRLCGPLAIMPGRKIMPLTLRRRLRETAHTSVREKSEKLEGTTAMGNPLGGGSRRARPRGRGAARRRGWPYALPCGPLERALDPLHAADRAFSGVV